MLSGGDDEEKQIGDAPLELACVTCFSSLLHSGVGNHAQTFNSSIGYWKDTLFRGTYTGYGMEISKRETVGEPYSRIEESSPTGILQSF